ncbi:transposase [Desulfofustis glycolicus]|uniref:transposase n=1 Tax=Desulfofustis glycolicus TaxID=51195 RepID=UPI001ABFB3B8|nr:transposase [Desulfofustis glycolicus]
MPVRLISQDEARFGRLSDPRRCWAPWPIRPLVRRALIREYMYAYAAVTPEDGHLDWMLADDRAAKTIGIFLQQVAQSHSNEFVIMVLDGAPLHRSRELEIPEQMALIRLPPYAPELNPVEHLWDELCEKEFANNVFDSLDAAVIQLAFGLWRLENNPVAIQSLIGWQWILESS